MWYFVMCFSVMQHGCPVEECPGITFTEYQIPWHPILTLW